MNPDEQFQLITVGRPDTPPEASPLFEVIGELEYDARTDEIKAGQ